MRRGTTQDPERHGVWVVDGAIRQLGWFFREQPVLDYGIDAHAEVVADDDLVTGQLLALQIKGGRSRFSKPYDGGWTFYGDSNHLAYWLGHSLPVVVVIVDEDGHAFWEQVTPSTTSETPEGFALKIPSSQPLNATTRDKLLAVAGRSKGLTASLPDFYAVLPPAAVATLQRAAGTDRLAAARLAERLAAPVPQAAPGAKASLLIAGQPSWLMNSAAAQDLWLSVAGYAAEHALPQEAGEAFLLAAGSPGPRSARARALAGIQLIPSDRDAARDLLRRARDDGEIVLADVGLAAADLPDGDARPVDIPASLRDAPQDVVRAEPFLLNFLAEAALRRREFTEAVTFREQAVAASGDGDSTYRLSLAESLRRRALSEPGNSGADLRRALGYAQAAVAGRRRWNGPSAGALGEVLDILITAGDMPEAVTAALPESAAGTALEAEATTAGVARRGAHAALASRNQAAYDFFMQLLADGPYRRELQALDDADHGQPREEVIAAWKRLIDDPADDAMTARCAAGLARLGVWPPQADELRARSLLPQAEYEALKAVCRAEAGQPEIGIARLRELSATSLIAAGELIHLLEKHEGPDAAISEAEQQATRWQAPALLIQYVDLLGSHGRFPEAAAFIQRAIPDQSLPAGVRVKLCGWYTAYQAGQGHLEQAAATARSGLAVATDADLAWKLVTVLVSDGKLGDARQALARYRPEPGTEQEMRLWMQLHLGITVTAGDAQVMISIAERLPDGEFRDATIAMLIREAAVAKDTGTFPTGLITAIAQLEASTRNRPGTGLRIDPSDDTALRSALHKRVPDQAAYQKLLASVQAGTACMADIAAFAARPYGTVLLHRPAGILPAADLAPGLRAAGEQAARQAVGAGACAADLSSLHLLGLLADDDRLRIRSALPHLTVARSAIDDALLTRDHVRNLSAATYTASLAPDGTIDRTTITATELALLRAHAETLETVAATAHVHRPAAPATVTADTIAVARESGLPLWCDDIALRQKARLAGVPAFSLLDLITVLAAGETALDQPGTLRGLAGQYVVDLPLSAADITVLAAGTSWLPGPAHTALARPAWWRHHDAGWKEIWLEIGSQARRHSAEALTTITRAALTGALQYVSPGYVVQRYQQIAVLAVIACHDAGQPAPLRLLDDLAQGADPARVPQPPFVLAAVISALRERGVSHPEEAAMRLLPGINLP
jgi:hypothetical protein